MQSETKKKMSDLVGKNNRQCAYSCVLISENHVELGMRSPAQG